MNNSGFFLLEAIGAIVLLSLFCTLLFPSFMTIKTSIQETKDERQILMLLHEYILTEQDEGFLVYPFPVTVTSHSKRHCAEWNRKREQELCLNE